MGKVLSTLIPPLTVQLLSRPMQSPSYVQFHFVYQFPNVFQMPSVQHDGILSIYSFWRLVPSSTLAFTQGDGHSRRVSNFLYPNITSLLVQFSNSISDSFMQGGVVAEWSKHRNGDLDVPSLNLVGAWPFFQAIVVAEETHMLIVNPVFACKCWMRGLQG